MTAECFGELAAALTVLALGGGARFAFVLAKDTDGFGVSFRPGVGRQIGDGDTAGRQSLEHVAEVGEYVQFVTRGAGNHRIRKRPADRVIGAAGSLNRGATISGGAGR